MAKSKKGSDDYKVKGILKRDDEKGKLSEERFV